MFDGRALEGWEIEELGGSQHGTGLQILDGAIVVTPRESAVSDELRSQNIVQDFSIRIGLEDVEGELHVGMEDLEHPHGFRETPGIRIPMDAGDRRSEVVLHVYGSRIAVDRDGQRYFEQAGRFDRPGGPVGLSCWNLSHPARVLAITVLGRAR